MRAKRSSRSRAFSLVEVVVALGVATFCLLVLFGLLPGGLHSNKITYQQTVAANLATAVMADLRSAPLQTSSYAPGVTNYSPRYAFSIPQAASEPMQTLYVTDSGAPLTVPGANLSASDDATNNVYRVTVMGPAQVAGPQPQRTASPIYLLITWPGQADATAAEWPSHYAGCFETLGYLDEN